MEEVMGMSTKHKVHDHLFLLLSFNKSAVFLVPVTQGMGPPFFQINDPS